MSYMFNFIVRVVRARIPLSSNFFLQVMKERLKNKGEICLRPQGV